MKYNIKTIQSGAVAAALALALAACGGGGGSSTLPTTGGGATNNPPTAPQMGKAQMSVLIPAKASSAKAQYISSSTQSVTISQNGTQIGAVDLTASSSNCTTGAGGSRTCTATFNAPVGTNELFAVTMWDATGGKGNKLSTGNVTATIQAGSVAQVPVTLDGVPVSAAVVLGTATLGAGNPGSTSVTVVAKDSGGNVIVGPGGYSAPIPLTITGDTYNTLALSSTSVTSPGQTISLAYNGGSNVGSTITATIGASTGTAAFNATGFSMNLFQDLDTANDYYLDPYDVAVAPTGATLMTPGNAVIMGYWDPTGYSTCCLPSFDVLAIAAPTTGVSKRYTGDVADPYATPTPGATNPPGAIMVHGMSTNIGSEEFEAYDDIAVGANGTIYYSGYYNSASNGSRCSAGYQERSGTIGVFNPSSATTVEKTLNGYPGPIKVDSSGNVWWIEYTGNCYNGSNTAILGSDTYAIGKMTPGGTITETKFSAAGLSSISYPGDMSITPDGSQMFIADESGNQIAKIATATFSSPTVIATKYSQTPYSINTAPDGTTLWYSDCDYESEYFYGYVQGSKTFSQASMAELAFPVPYAFAYTSAYADGSFWTAVEESSGSGIGRISNVSAGAPINGFYQTAAVSGGSPEWSSIAAGGGYVWSTDYDFYNISAAQYGAPSTGTYTFSARHHGMAMPQHFTHPHRTAHHAPGGKVPKWLPPFQP